MKKIALFAAVALIGASTFTSCSSKKDYTCECVTTINGQAAQTQTIELKDYKKSDAETACSANVQTGQGVSMACELK